MQYKSLGPPTMKKIADRRSPSKCLVLLEWSIVVVVLGRERQKLKNKKK